MSLVAQTAPTVVEVHLRGVRAFTPDFGLAGCEADLAWSACASSRRPLGRNAYRSSHEQGVDGNREEGGRHGRLPRGSAIPQEAEGPTTLAISARASSSSPGAHIRNGRDWSGAP